MANLSSKAKRSRKKTFKTSRNASYWFFTKRFNTMVMFIAAVTWPNYDTYRITRKNPEKSRTELKVQWFKKFEICCISIMWKYNNGKSNLCVNSAK